MRLVALACVAAWAPAARAEPERSRSPSIYDVNLAIDGTVILASTAAVVLPYSLSSRLIEPTCPCAPSSVNAFDRGVIGNASDTAARISDATVVIAILASPVADWLALGASRPLLDDMIVYAESLSVNGALVTLAKYTVQRPIPRAYSDPVVAANPHSYRSFYSGHTSLVFAALSTTSVTLNARYRLTWQPWAASLLIGASVAVERVLGGYHFYTDVLVGAAAGFTVGAVVPIVHLRSRGLRLAAFRPAGGDGIGIQIGGML